MTTTNIKNLPNHDETGLYFTGLLHTDTKPYMVLTRTAKTVTVCPIRVKPDPDWKPEMIPGGFAAHCTNQRQQTWLYDGVDDTQMKTLRLTKKGWVCRGQRFIEDRAIRFHDYNF